MDETTKTVLCCLGAFLLGSIPFGFLAGKLLKGIDLREHGSRNIGATNVLRILGVVPGTIVLLLDALKGFTPVAIANRTLELPPWAVVAVSMCAVLGHIYTPFLRFRGGKGVATSLGVLVGLSAAVAAGSLAVFAVVVWATRYVSLGSIVGALTQAALFWLLPPVAPLPYRVFGLVVAAFVIVRHRVNIQKLLRGTENKFGKKKEEVSPGV